MGIVIRFPLEERIAHEGRRLGTMESASVIILPVIRIQRFEEPTGRAPETGNRPGRGRRRRASPT
jgi:hypothetical protein